MSEAGAAKGKRKRQQRNDAPDVALDSSDTAMDETWSPTVDFAFLYSLVRQISPEAQPSMPIPEHDAAAPQVQVCTRAYEDAFLFEPSMHERPCVNGRTHCESVAMGGPVLKEFLLPSDTPAASSTRPCLLCTRTAVAQAHFQALTEQHSNHHVILQRHCNAIGGVGEYSPESCLVPAACATGLIAPVVLHTRSSLRSTTVDGIRGWKQLYATPAAGVGNANNDNNNNNSTASSRVGTADGSDNARQSFLARLAV
tara:strand:- start:1776 stop:2540 length:765 start_codon:yes stop_codon:yes gene_type:complete